MLALVILIGVLVSFTFADAGHEPHAPLATIPDKACQLAVRAAHTYGVHVKDFDNNGVIDIEDIRDHAITFGMYWADTNHDGNIDEKELSKIYTDCINIFKRVASWATSFVTPKYTLEQLYIDCDANKDRLITRKDYDASLKTCLNTCGKAEDVFSYIGAVHGAVPTKA